MLSREEVLGRGLDLNLGDGEEKVDIFVEALYLVARMTSAVFLCCRGDMVKILCSGWRHPWRCSNGYWSEHPWKF